MEVRVEQLTKVYGTQHAVDEVSFSLKPGEVVGFLGPNGAGKSTTMKIMTGFKPATKGEVLMGDLSIRENSLDIRKRIGYLPENNPMYLEMYVHEYLRFVGRLHGITGKTLKNRVVEVVQMTGLVPEQTKKITELSKGFRQRVGLAQALLHDPEFLILDEPTSGLDVNQVLPVRELIKSLGETKTVLFSSHILSEVEAIADRVIIINNGKIIADSPIEQLRQISSGSNVLDVEFERAGFAFEQIQEKVSGLSITTLSATTYRLQYGEGEDLRKLIYAQSVAQDNPILALTQGQSRLEDVFRELTTRDDA